jgi:hypothetical protein
MSNTALNILLFVLGLGATAQECDVEVVKADMCVPFSVYEWGLSRCVLITGTVVNFNCGKLENVKVCVLFTCFEQT